MSENLHLKRELSFFDLVILGIVGAIGTGVLFSTAGMTAIAGPGSLLSWLLGGIFYLFIGFTYIELSATYPEAGGPSRYVLYTHGWFTNLINSFADLIWYLFIAPIEAFAIVYGLTIFYPSLVTAKGFPTFLGAGLAVLLLLIMLPFNYFGTRVFGKSTLALGLVKLVFYLAVAFGLAAVVFHAVNFTIYGGVAPFGAAGIFAATPLAMFAFGGIRVLPDYAEESKNYKKLPLAIVIVVIGQLLIYLLFDFVFVSGIDWSRLGITPGNWAGVSGISGNPFITMSHSYNAPFLFILTLIVGVIGPFVVGYIYVGGGSRIMYAMSRTQIMPQIAKFLHKKFIIPYWAILIMVLVGAFLAFLAAPLPNIYTLIEDAVVAGYLGFSVNPVALVVTRRQGQTKWRVPGGSILAVLGFASAALIVFWSGWITVYYSVLILLAAVIIFGILVPLGRGTWKRDLKHFPNSLWYIFYIAFLLVMTYIGSDGALNILSFYDATAVTVAVSLVVFFPLGVLSGLKTKLDVPEYRADVETSTAGAK
ncbi:MAG: APC family permease [Candidatus Thermoplasmatota archaeon]|nr:APC family permease [Candidatus Thermoplasmatota archaeon]MCL5789854.1 APC family permease [Candidatus Thermoplasmatota archaeon]